MNVFHSIHMYQQIPVEELLSFLSSVRNGRLYRQSYLLFTTTLCTINNSNTYNFINNGSVGHPGQNWRLQLECLQFPPCYTLRHECRVYFTCDASAHLHVVLLPFIRIIWNQEIQNCYIWKTITWPPEGGQGLGDGMCNKSSCFSP